jgi:Kef-type K+ transport system membrane component KefB
MGEGITEIIMHLVLQLAVILVMAKLAAEVCERWLKVPPVLGELVVGIVIGPYALGTVQIPGLGPLFPLPDVVETVTAIPVSIELYSIAQVAAVVLLFVIGLETDFRQFLRFAGPGLLVAIGGVVVPFLLGAWLTVVFGFAEHFGDAKALFMGAILTATSVGITARVLSDMGKLGTPEGVTVLAAAVIDDVIGILVLTIVVGIAGVGVLSAGYVAGVTLKAVGFWLGLTAGGLLFAKFIANFIGWFKTAGAAIGLMLALGFLTAALAEQAGLAMIIGAYSMGLALSGTSLARRLEEQLRGVYNALVPVFFVVMGMMVDVRSMTGMLAFGAVITVAAIVGKVFGAGLPSLLVGFNIRGAWRIGVGMLPRGEVALIVAGIGLTRGVVDNELFGVAILTTVVTTLLAPPILLSLFSRGGSGRRQDDMKETGEQ